MSKNKYKGNYCPQPLDYGKIAYPSINGVAVDPIELDLGSSRLNPNNKHNFNNHHGEFYNRLYDRKMGAAALFNFFHDLESNQYPMLIDQHDRLHDRFGAPAFPTAFQAREKIELDLSNNGRLRKGSLGHPNYTSLEIIMEQVDRSYDLLGGREERVLVDMGAR